MLPQSLPILELHPCLAHLLFSTVEWDRGAPSSAASEVAADGGHHCSLNIMHPEGSEKELTRHQPTYRALEEWYWEAGIYPPSFLSFVVYILSLLCNALKFTPAFWNFYFHALAVLLCSKSLPDLIRQGEVNRLHGTNLGHHKRPLSEGICGCLLLWEENRRKSKLMPLEGMTACPG